MHAAGQGPGWALGSVGSLTSCPRGWMLEPGSDGSVCGNDKRWDRRCPGRSAEGHPYQSATGEGVVRPHAQIRAPTEPGTWALAAALEAPKPQSPLTTKGSVGAAGKVHMGRGSKPGFPLGSRVQKGPARRASEQQRGPAAAPRPPSGAPPPTGPAHLPSASSPPPSPPPPGAPPPIGPSHLTSNSSPSPPPPRAPPPTGPAHLSSAWGPPG